MAVLNYLYVTCASTPVSQDSPSIPAPQQRPTKIILPRKKPLKWSAGVAPGEYGGPPTTSKLRKYWGEDEDPLTSDEYIWNKDFMGRMKRLIEDFDYSSPERATAVEEESSGFLSLNRVMNLDRLDIDLSKDLTSPSKIKLEEQTQELLTQSSGRRSSKWKLAPTRREQDKWNRASKAATGGTEVMFRELRKPQGDPQVLAAKSREQYFKLKKKLQIVTLGIGGVGFLSSYISYTPEVAASFGVGFLGSLVYIRMLGSSVDSMADGAKGVVRGAIAQPRLLVPVVLVMIYNRWNGILVPQYGYMHLELIPMLVGFFTYKIATFIQAVEDAVSVVGKRT